MPRMSRAVARGRSLEETALRQSAGDAVRRDRLGVTGPIMKHPELGDLHCAGRHPDCIPRPLSVDGCLSPSGGAVGLSHQVP
jgi:hypothetical protein